MVFCEGLHSGFPNRLTIKSQAIFTNFCRRSNIVVNHFPNEDIGKHPEFFVCTIRPTDIVKSLANGTTTIESRHPVIIVRAHGSPSSRTLPWKG